jgi:hypothetical protein
VHGPPTHASGLCRRDLDGSRSAELYFQDYTSYEQGIDEVAELLKITPKQIRRLEQRGAFPILRLPKPDRHPRYARRLVERSLRAKRRRS